jgi:DNA-binding FadR family transcriptional regulator
MRKEGDLRKLGEILAERIEDEIISTGWVIGSVVGSEAELVDKYGVSRAVFREAMRIVDHHGVAEMRRGPGGGLVVTAPDLGAMVRAVSLQLHFEKIQPAQVLEARRALELDATRLAAQRITPEGAAKIKEVLAAEEQLIKETRDRPRSRGDLPSHDFHLLLAELAGNPAMKLFVQMINRVLGEQAPRMHSLDETATEVHRAHLRIAQAVMAGDFDAAERRMSRHLSSVLTYFPEEELVPSRKRSSSKAAAARTA